MSEGCTSSQMCTVCTCLCQPVAAPCASTVPKAAPRTYVSGQQFLWACASFRTRCGVDLSSKRSQGLLLPRDWRQAAEVAEETLWRAHLERSAAFLGSESPRRLRRRLVYRYASANTVYATVGTAAVSSRRKRSKPSMAPATERTCAIFVQ